MTESRWLSDMEYARSHGQTISGYTGIIGDEPLTAKKRIDKPMPTIAVTNVEPVTLLTQVEVLVPPDALLLKLEGIERGIHALGATPLGQPVHMHGELTATPASAGFFVVAPAIAMFSLWAGRVMRWAIPMLIEGGIDKAFGSRGMSFGGSNLRMRIMTSQGPGRGRYVSIRPEGGKFANPKDAGSGIMLGPFLPPGDINKCGWTNPWCYLGF